MARADDRGAGIELLAENPPAGTAMLLVGPYGVLLLGPDGVLLPDT
jgi:hypothetical protein